MPVKALVLLCCWALLAGVARSQDQRYWVGGSGQWADRAHWSTTAGGPGGASPPRSGDDVTIAPHAGETVVTVDGSTDLRSLRMDGTRGTLILNGKPGRIRIHGDVALRGNVLWNYLGRVELLNSGGAVGHLDLRGIPLQGDLLIAGGTWSMQSDLVVDDRADIELHSGTLVTNGSMLRAGRLALADRGAKLMAGSSVVYLVRGFAPGNNAAAVDPGTSRLLVGGSPVDWGGEDRPAADAQRGANVCGTGAGQTPFTVDAQLLSNYNGYGVSCHGVCDGQVSVTVTGGSGNFTYGWVGGPQAATWNNVCPGNQIVIVTDQGQGISCAATVQVTDPSLLSVIFSGNTPPTCAGVCNGTSSAFAVGGVPPYSYNWNNGAGSGSVFTQLCPGANTLHVTDINGCAFDTTFIFSIDPLQPNLTTTDALCTNTCDGTAELAPTGGSGSYTYNWEPGNPAGDGTEAVTGLCAGNWSVTVTDANGCDTTVNFTIDQPPPIIPNATHVDATCGNTCDGSATVAPTGGSGTYDYSWVPEPGGGQNTADATGLCAGVYEVTITDTGTGCDTVVAITIDAPPAIDPHPTSTDATCAGVCDGTASVAPTGGSGNYDYDWSPEPGGGQNTADATGLCAGAYEVTITDTDNGCDTVVAITIGEPAAILPQATVTDAGCFGACDGSIVLAPTGGTGTYTYSWDPVGAGTGNTATDLCAGDYGVTISSGGCDTTLSFSITSQPPLAMALSFTGASCGGGCDGTASASGGLPDYGYDWSPAPGGGQNTPNATGLCPGDYTVTVSNSAGCDTVMSFTIDAPPVIEAHPSSTDATCAGACDGTASVAPTGGSGNYGYDWSPEPGGGQNSADATGLCAGVYEVTITDTDNGCDTVVAITIGEPAAILPQATVTDAGCFGECNGSIVLAPTGGTGTYTYTWDPVGAGTGNTATDLCAGDYGVTISSGGCDTTLSFSITSQPPLAVALSFTGASCGGGCDGTASASGGLPDYGYDWSPAPGGGQNTPNATGLCPGDYTVTVSNSAGCDTVMSFTIDAPPPVLAALNLVNASCGTACDGSASVQVSGGTPGFTYTWTPDPGQGQGTADATGMCPGSYTLLISDSLGCDTLIDFLISRPGGIHASGTVSPASCADNCDGAIDMVATGGVEPYDWTWSPEPGTGQGTPNVGGLCPGEWTVLVGDQAGCDTTLVFTVGAPDPIEPNGTFTNESCAGPCDGTATVSPTGGSGNFSYNWSPTPAAGQGTPSVSGLCAGDWCVTITDDAGCDTTWCFTVLPASPITASVATVDGACWNTCTGEATVTATGGAGGFDYLWTPEPGGGQGTDHATGLCQGPGSVTITDAGGCDTTITFEIFKNPPIQPNLTVYAETCAGACTGDAEAYPSGGSGVFDYHWSPEPDSGQGTNIAMGLCAGVDYTLTITDSSGCDTIIPFTVPAFMPVVPVLATTQATCADACDGTATIMSTTGGTPPYTYFWTPEPPNGQADSLATGLCPGTYLVNVKDADECDTTLEFTITAPDPIEPQATVTPIGCGGECTGAIDLDTQGGSGGFIYLWSPEPPEGQGTAHVSELCAGEWAVTISDANGCDTTVTFTLDEPQPLLATVDATVSHCGVCDGTAQIHVSGGTGPYTFTWGPPLNIVSSDSLMVGLCAGVYIVRVVDDAGCEVQIAVAIQDAVAEVLAMTDGSTTCPDTCDGTASVAYTCGVTPCTVAWTDILGNDLGQTSDTLHDLCAGSYIAAVTNGDGCVAVDTATVVAPPAMTADISSEPVNCAGSCDGSATIAVNGGSGQFEYTWTPEPGAGQGSTHVTGLCAGSYDVLVHDLVGCDAVFSVLITSPPPITVAAMQADISCAGACDGNITLDAQGGTGTLSYLWSPMPPNGQGTASVSGLCAGGYMVTISDTNGCDTTIAFTVTEPEPLALTGSATPSHCTVCDGTASVTPSGGTGTVTVEWTQGGSPAGTGLSLTGLCAGIYTATATDDHDCSTTLTVVVPDADAEDITAVDGQTFCANSCDGAVSVSYNCSATPCTATWYDAAGNQLALGQDSLGGLCSGTYIVQVANGVGCLAMDTAMVTPSQTIVPNLSTTPVSCPGACDGTATVGPTGGTAPYTYTWGPGTITGQGTPQATDLCAGSYEVLISDSLGCDTVVHLLITAPAAILVSAAVTNVTCNGAGDGSIVLSPAGGNGFFSYVWSPVPPNGQGSNGAFGLYPGEWTVTIADLHGCDTTIVYTITEPDALSAATNGIMSTCGACDGAASVQPAGGTPPYSFTWIMGGATVGTDSLITGLCAGLYTVQVTDAHACSVTVAVPVGDIGGEVVSTTGYLLTCPDACDGVVSADYNCGNPTCTVAWFDALGNDLGQSGDTLSGLCAGSYFVQVTNGLGCISLDTAIVSAPDPIVANLSTTPVTCAGDCDGTATVGPTGGAGGYDYHWELGTGTAEGTPQVVDLCAGTYEVTITDLAGCSITQDVLITTPQPITATAVAVPVACNGACDGSITVTGQGGTGALTYSWSPEPGAGQNSNTASDLCAGDWTVTITDTHGCDTTFTITIPEPSAITVDLSHTDNACYNDCVATAHAEVSGGMPPYAITWTGPGGATIAQDTLDVQGLCGGAYTLTVTDSMGCAIATPFTVATGTPIEANLSFQGESCNGPCDGSASVAPTGGADTLYTYSWQPMPDSGQGTPHVSGLCPGDWTVTISDGAGCDTTYAFTITPFMPITPVATVQQVSCNGACNGSIALAVTGGVDTLTYIWTPEPGSGQGTPSIGDLCPGNYSVTITDAAGCDTSVNFSITEPPAVVVQVDTVIAASCNSAQDGAIAITASGGVPDLAFAWTGPNGFSSSAEDPTGLAPGTYNLVVTDSNACQLTSQVVVGALSTVVADAGPDNVECSGTEVVLDGSASQGAATYAWTDGQGNAVGSTALISLGILADGPHLYILTVADGPCSDVDTVAINVLPLPIADAGPDQVVFVQGTPEIGGNPTGPPGSTFVWQPDSLLDHGDVPNPTATVNATTWFTVMVTGPDGCTGLDSMLVTVVPEVKVPSGFTPNGDGHNDTWVLDFAKEFPGIDVKVFSRWGEPLFHSVGYATPWDGKYDGQVVPMGTYYYAIDLHDPRYPDALTGPLTVIR